MVGGAKKGGNEKEPIEAGPQEFAAGRRPQRGEKKRPLDRIALIAGGLRLAGGKHQKTKGTQKKVMQRERVEEEKNAQVEKEKKSGRASVRGRRR